MRFSTCLTLSLLILATKAFAGLDLTPVDTLLKGNEGPGVSVIQVSDGDIKYNFLPPGDWLAYGDGKSLAFNGSDQSWMKIIAVPMQGAPPISTSPQQQPTPDPQSDAQSDDKSSKEALQKWLAQFIPSGAANVTFVNTTPSPYMLEGHPSTEFIFSFVGQGRRNFISISVVDFSAMERIVMLVSAGSDNFANARSIAISCMSSWSVTKKK